MTPTLRPLPPRRLLAVAASLALLGSSMPLQAKTSEHRKTSLDGSEPTCPLGTFHCAPRPDNYAMCRPNAMLEFYDPTLTKDTTLRDTAVTKARADSVTGSNQTVYHMQGNVWLQRADQQLQADTADYNDQTTDYDAAGNVRYQEAGQLLAASHMRGNQSASTGTADDVRYQLLQSRGNGVAAEGQMFDAQHSLYHMASYSTCDVGHHLWEFRAKSIAINKDTGVGTARSATMRVGKVPFMYLPYFTFPIDNRRKSGFLYPVIGNTSRAGFQVSAPYYLNLAPNYDATIDPRYYSDRGPMLAGEFRYLVPGSTGTFDFEYVPHDHGGDDGTLYHGAKDEDRYLLKFTDWIHLWQSWSINSNINRASDAAYLYDFGNDLYTSSIGTLSSSIYASGGGNWWSASVGGDVYQNVNPYVPDATNPYNRLPRATFNLNLPITNWLEFGSNNEAVAFRKDDAVEGQREDLYPYLQADFGNAGWFVRPRVAYRYTAYQLNAGYQNYGYGYAYTGVPNGRLAPGQASPFTQADPTRSVPITSIDSGLIFDRPTSLFGTSYTQTLEPRLYYLYVPYRNQNNLPLFDSSLMSFDYWQLFSPNQYAGADRQMNANNLTGALTTRLLDENGVERVSASFGQIRYFSQQLVQLPNGANTVTPKTNWAGSDYVAELSVQLNDQWKLDTQYQYNPNLHQTDLGVLETQFRLKNDGIFNFSYRYRHYPNSTQLLLNQYSVSAVYPLNPTWRLIGAWTWSKLYRRTIEAVAGVEYDSCCVALRLVGRNYVNLGYLNQTAANVSSTGRNNAVMFEIEFKGLGSTSSQIEPLLQRDILGYQ